MIEISTPVRSPRRYGQLQRVHVISELLRRSLEGWTLDAINRAVGEQIGGPCHIRTTRRDLTFLESLGVAGRFQTLANIRWRWIAERPLIELTPALGERHGAA